MNFNRLREFQDSLVSWRIPGNDCAVYKDGKIVYRHITGYADVEHDIPLMSDSLYYFWSVSKLITTSLALRLYENGKFKMDDPLSKYLPEFRHMSVKTAGGTLPARNPILIRHLFNMTAGFDYNLNSHAINDVRRASQGKCPTREVARAIAKSPLLFEPGTHWNYSLCHDVLGAFIETASGKRLRDYAQDELFTPLEMTDTSYGLPVPEKMKRLANLYCWRDDLGCFLPTQNTCAHILGPDYDSGGAGIVSSCTDIMKFASCIAEGGIARNGYRYLSPGTVNMWKTNTLTHIQASEIEKMFSHMRGYGYGYGVRTVLSTEQAGVPQYCNEFGWDGAAGAIVILDCDRRMALVYTQHMLNSQEEYIFPRLRNILYESI